VNGTPVIGPIAQLRDHYGSWPKLEAASGFSTRTWIRWARGGKPQTWAARIVSRLFYDAGIMPPWITPELQRILEHYDEQKTEHR